MQSIVNDLRAIVQMSRRIHIDIMNLFGGTRGPPFSESTGFLTEPAFIGAETLPPYRIRDIDTNLEEKKLEGFLWGVPKKRVSIEKRWCKQIGAHNWYWKMLIPKYNIRTCETCGHHYEAKHLCRNCYERVKTETEGIRKQIESDIGNNPEDKGVVVLYENEKQLLEVSKRTLPKGHMFVEVSKPRPAWFSSNLLQKTTAEPDPVTTTVTTTKPNLS